MSSNGTSDDAMSCETPLPYYLVMIIVNALSTVVGAIGNILVCIAVWRTQSLHSIINYHMVSLALADLIVTILVQPLMIGVLTGRLAGTLDCQSTLDTVYRAIGNFSCAASFLNLCLITLERILAVYSPFRTYNHSRSKPLLFALSVTWLLPLVYAMLRVFTSRRATNYFSVSLFALGYIWMVAGYVIILVLLRIHSKKQKTLTIMDRKKNKSERKITITMIFVIVCFTTMWLPFFYFRLSKNSSLNRGYVYELLITLALCNSSLNPIIYSFRNRKYRNAFWSILRCETRSNLAIQSTTKHSNVSRTNSSNNVFGSSALTLTSLPTPPTERRLFTSIETDLATNV